VEIGAFESGASRSLRVNCNHRQMLINWVVSLNCRDELGWFLSIVAFSMMSHSFLKKCEMDWESLYCPNLLCRYDGRPCLQRQLVSNKLSVGHAKRM